MRALPLARFTWIVVRSNAPRSCSIRASSSPARRRSFTGMAPGIAREGAMLDAGTVTSFRDNGAAHPHGKLEVNR